MNLIRLKGLADLARLNVESNQPEHEKALEGCDVFVGSKIVMGRDELSRVVCHDD